MINKYYFINIWNLCSSKDTIKRAEKHPWDWERVFIIYVYIWQFTYMCMHAHTHIYIPINNISRIHMEFPQVSDKKQSGAMEEGWSKMDKYKFH